MPKRINPHFDLPFRYDSRTNPVCVEQDTVDDVAVCVEAILRTPVGQRIYNPTFGAPEMTFAQRPVDVDTLVNRVEAWEPRVRLAMVEDTDETLITRIRTTVETKE